MALPPLAGLSYEFHVDDGSDDTDIAEVFVGSSSLNDMGPPMQDIMSGAIRVVSRVSRTQTNWNQTVFNPPSTAQNEQFWTVQFTDNVTMIQDVYLVPSPDLTLLVPGESVLDINTPGSPGLAFVQAWEQDVVSRDGNPITINFVRFLPT